MPVEINTTQNIMWKHLETSTWRNGVTPSICVAERARVWETGELDWSRSYSKGPLWTTCPSAYQTFTTRLPCVSSRVAKSLLNHWFSIQWGRKIFSLLDLPITKDHRLWGLKQQLISSQFWRLESSRSKCQQLWFLPRTLSLAYR